MDNNSEFEPLPRRGSSEETRRHGDAGTGRHGDTVTRGRGEKKSDRRVSVSPRRRVSGRRPPVSLITLLTDFGTSDYFVSAMKGVILSINPDARVVDITHEIPAQDIEAPVHLGDKMSGKTCAGTWVKGFKDGKAREVYIYQVADNKACMDKWGCQAVVAQTAFSAVIAMDLIEHGLWKGVGVLGPEAFEPTVFMEKMADYGFPYGIKEMTKELSKEEGVR